MANPRFDRYLESEILNASPTKLVAMLYRGGIEAVVAARKHLAAGAIADRSRQIQKAWDILHELAQSLDRKDTSGLAQSLASLYAYMQQRLLDANTQQADEPLAEVESLLITIGEAWLEVKLRAPSPEQVPVLASP